MSTQSATINILGVKVSIAMIALCCLVAQTTAAVVLTRYSKMVGEIPNDDGSKKEKYSNASLVVSTEFVKFVASLCLVFLFDTVEKLQADAKAGRETIPNGTSGSATPAAEKEPTEVNNRSPAGTEFAASAPPSPSITPIPTSSNAAAIAIDSANAGDEKAPILLSDAVPPFTSFKGLKSRYGAWKAILHKENFADLSGTMKLCVPALLYTVQNNVIYTALNNLEATTFQVGYQSKVVTTAVLSVLMLNRSLSPLKWLSLLILTTGIVLTQLQPATDGNKKAGGTTSGSNANEGAAAVGILPIDTTTIMPTAIKSNDIDADGNLNNQMVGMIAVMVASFCSAFAGVYFEKILKGTAPSVWVRNAQLAFFSMIIGLIGYYLSLHPDDAFKVMDYFKGYNALVLSIIVVQALGGLIIACVVKYADNILKGFATAMSIVLCGILSALFMGFIPSVMFVFGSSVVILATLLYSKPDKK